jgi:hypothetical protein
MIGGFEIRNLELDVLGAAPKVTGRTTKPSEIAALPETMP